ncbi:hypothetical protein F5884DRAFT_549341 [Xylogone sp. PMI_703]|nr:hypothetical protein F5884DRAFT_549341 [Xylogone sp. PMI_703]
MSVLFPMLIILLASNLSHTPIDLWSMNNNIVDAAMLVNTSITSNCCVVVSSCVPALAQCGAHRQSAGAFSSGYLKKPFLELNSSHIL